MLPQLLLQQAPLPIPLVELAQELSTSNIQSRLRLCKLEPREARSEEQQITSMRKDQIQGFWLIQQFEIHLVDYHLIYSLRKGLQWSPVYRVP